MNTTDHLVAQIMILVSNAVNRRMRRQELERILRNRFRVPPAAIREVLDSLVINRKLLSTVRNSYRYLELPLSESGHLSQPMKVVFDSHGDPWICEAHVNPAGDLEKQGGWRYSDLRRHST